MRYCFSICSVSLLIFVALVRQCVAPLFLPPPFPPLPSSPCHSSKALVANMLVVLFLSRDFLSSMCRPLCFIDFSMEMYPVGNGAADSFCGCPLCTSNVERSTASVAASRGMACMGGVAGGSLRIIGACAFVENWITC